MSSFLVLNTNCNAGRRACLVVSASNDVCLKCHRNNTSTASATCRTRPDISSYQFFLPLHQLWQQCTSKQLNCEWRVSEWRLVFVDMTELLGANPIASSARLLKADFNGALLKGTLSYRLPLLTCFCAHSHRGSLCFLLWDRWNRTTGDNKCVHSDHTTE